MADIRDGKPGEVWHVTDPSGRWASYRVLDGEDLETAHELGFDGNCVVLTEWGVSLSDRYGPADRFAGLMRVTDPILLKGEPVWRCGGKSPPELRMDEIADDLGRDLRQRPGQVQGHAQVAYWVLKGAVDKGYVTLVTPKPDA